MKKNAPKKGDPSSMLEHLTFPETLIPTDPRFGTGPSLIPLDHVKKLYETGSHYLGTSHRKAPLKTVIQEVRKRIHHYFDLPDSYTVALGNGGATFLFDMVGLGMVVKKSIHYTCGEFSKKWYKAHANIPWIEAQEVSVPFGQGVTPRPHGDADFIACTLNETSTGAMIDAFPDVDDHTLIGVDATSGAGQCACDVSKIDVFFFSPQKVFASEGGLFICILSPKACERIAKIQHDTTRYIPEIMNWMTCLDNSRKNQTYTTPSLSTIFLLNQQLKKLIAAGGLQKVQQEAQKKASFVYDWADRKDYLSPYIKEKRYRSCSVATIDVEYPVSKILEFLEKKNLVYNINSYRKLGRNQFRIALFPNITFENIQRLTGLLSFILEKMEANG